MFAKQLDFLLFWGVGAGLITFGFWVIGNQAIRKGGAEPMSALTLSAGIALMATGGVLILAWVLGHA